MSARVSRSLKPLVSRRSVFVVTYAYDYEGETVEAIYATEAGAKSHPHGGDRTHIREMPVIRKRANEEVSGRSETN